MLPSFPPAVAAPGARYAVLLWITYRNRHTNVLAFEKNFFVQ
jgi:hypothetical protein